jgi:hypothetical protein
LCSCHQTRFQLQTPETFLRTSANLFPFATAPSTTSQLQASINRYVSIFPATRLPAIQLRLPSSYACAIICPSLSYNLDGLLWVSATMHHEMQRNGWQRQDLQDGLHKPAESLRKPDELACSEGPARCSCSSATVLWTVLGDRCSMICFCGMRVSGRGTGVRVIWHRRCMRIRHAGIVRFV